MILFDEYHPELALCSPKVLDEIFQNIQLVLACLPKSELCNFLRRMPLSLREFFINEILTMLKDEDVPQKASDGTIQRIFDGIEARDHDPIKAMTGILESEYEKKSRDETDANLGSSLRWLNNSLTTGALRHLLSTLSEPAQNEIYEIIIRAAIAKNNGFGRSPNGDQSTK
jgi:hypothetical protein